MFNTVVSSENIQENKKQVPEWADFFVSSIHSNRCVYDMGKVKPNHFFRGTAESDLLQQAILNKRRTVLKKILLQYMGLALSREQPEMFRVDVEYAGLGEELLALSSSLAVKESDIPEKALPLDIEVNGVVIALDDEPQFNRYRLQTLQSPVYSLPLIYDLSRYKNYCQDEQISGHGDMTSTGKKLQDRKSLQKIAGVQEDLLKLQAVNDFMQDLLPLVHYVPLLRLSVYDQIVTPSGSKSLHALLIEDNRRNFELLADYFIRQLDDLEEAFNLEY